MWSVYGGEAHIRQLQVYGRIGKLCREWEWQWEPYRAAHGRLEGDWQDGNNIVGGTSDDFIFPI
ncbi:hypothetical protein K250101E9_47790 [Enterocloster aldenensis]